MSETNLRSQEHEHITREILRRTGAQSMAELSDKVFLAVKRGIFSGGQFRPGVPAKFKRFALREVDGKPQPCIILEYLNGLHGQTVEYAHPTKKMFHELEFIPQMDCITTYAKRITVEKGF